MPTAPRRSRDSTERRQLIAPVRNPAIRLPAAHSASRTPASALTPRSSVNATVVTSAAPNRVPRASEAMLSGTTVAQGIRARSRLSASGGVGGGSVARCTLNARVPETPATRAVPSPATGCTAVASRVTRIGPRM